MDRETVRRFWRKVPRMPEAECWEWTGTYMPNGAPVFSIAGKNHVASRLMWQLAGRGDVPPGRKLMRTCGNPRCVNPRHLVVPGLPAPEEMLTRPRMTLQEMAEAIGARLVPVGRNRYRVELARRKEVA